MSEEHTHSTVNGDHEHLYTHDHEDGHKPHDHNDPETFADLWEEE